MAKDKNHVYSIDLDVKSTAASKQAFKELQTAFDNGKKSTKELNLAYIRMASTMKDTSVLDAQYNKVIKDRIKDRETELDKLKAQQIKIMNNTKMSEHLRENLLENNRINQSRIQNEIDRLNKANLVQLKLEREKVKAAKEAAEKLKEEEIRRKKLSTYVKADLAALRDKIKSQLKFIAMLKTTEGRYNAIKKTLVGMVKLSGKLTAGIAGGALALGGVLGGAITGTADSLVEKDKAMASLKSGIDPTLVDDVYVKTGGDYESIVAAINSLSDVTRDNASIVQGAVLELANPGAGKLLLSTSKIEANNGDKLSQAISQIKKQTGVQDMSAALEAATKSWSVSTKKVSQVDYLQAYAALQQRGFDEEQIEKIVNDVSLKKGNFVDNLNKTDLRKYTDDEQMRVRLAKTPLGLEKLALNGEEPTKSNWQSVAERMRTIELKKTALLEKFIPIFEKVIDGISNALDTSSMQTIADGLVDLFVGVLPLLKPVFGLLKTLLPPLITAAGWFASLATDFIGVFVEPLVQAIGRMLNNEDISITETIDPDKIIHGSRGIIFTEEDYEKAKTEELGVASKLDKEVVERFFKKYGMPMAQNGGSVVPHNSEHIALVLPDYSNTGRTSQLIQNFNTTQSFNMASNQQTPLAFSQAVGNNRFILRVNGL